ncbi:MAG: hypothetical protein KAR38_04490, partial [Calditrichia bacterium]|nr:hypothetical protein [Calditrichia bacterium]
TPINTKINDYCKNNKLTSSSLLQDGNIALSTIKNGVAIINQKGQLIQIINKDKGIPGNTIWNLYSDNHGGLWLALNNGISRIVIPSPITLFNETAGLEGTVESVVRHNGVLYVATPLGLYYINPETKSIKLNKIPSFRPYKLLSIGKSLIASGYNSGIYELHENKMKLISNYSPYSFCRSKIDSNRIFLGLDNAVASIYQKNSRWIKEGHINLNTTPIRDIVETSNGHLWLRTSGSMICKVSFPENGFSIQNAQINYFDKNSGLTLSKQNYIFSFNNKIIFGNNNRLLKYEETTERFNSDKTFSELFVDKTRSVIKLIQDNNNNVWMFTSSKSGLEVGVALLQPDGSYKWD